jgi:hypothetical protein
MQKVELFHLVGQDSEVVDNIVNSHCSYGLPNHGILEACDAVIPDKFQTIKAERLTGQGTIAYLVYVVLREHHE